MNTSVTSGLAGCVTPTLLVSQIEPITHTTFMLFCSWSVTTVMSQGLHSQQGTRDVSLLFAEAPLSAAYTCHQEDKV